MGVHAKGHSRHYRNPEFLKKVLAETHRIGNFETILFPAIPGGDIRKSVKAPCGSKQEIRGIAISRLYT